MSDTCTDDKFKNRKVYSYTPRNRNDTYFLCISATTLIVKNTNSVNFLFEPELRCWAGAPGRRRRVHSQSVVVVVPVEVALVPHIAARALAGLHPPCGVPPP